MHAPCARCCPTRPIAPAPSGLHTSPNIVCPAFDSAARVQVQSAGELRHVQRHEHGRHVPRALAARALATQPFTRGSSVCTPLAPATAPRALAPAPSGPHTSTPYHMLCFRPRQDASAFNQSVSFDTSRVTDMAGMFISTVRSPRVLCPPSPYFRALTSGAPLQTGRTHSRRTGRSARHASTDAPKSVQLGRADCDECYPVRLV